MHKRQFQAMLKKRALKRDAQPMPAYDPQAAEREMRERDAAILQEKIGRLWKRMDEEQVWHWLWRVGKIEVSYKKHGAHPWHLLAHTNPKTGKPKSIRTILGLPFEPHRDVLDTKVGVVPIYIRSLPQKGSQTILKPHGFREVDTNPQFYLHSKLVEMVKPVDLFKWLAKVLHAYDNGLVETILWLERMYGKPRRIVMTADLGTKEERLVSRKNRIGATRVPARGARLRRAERFIVLRTQGKKLRPFYQDQQLVHKDYSFEKYR